jgi:hypothetical protein
MLFIFSTPLLSRHLWQLKTLRFLHWCEIRSDKDTSGPYYKCVTIVIYNTCDCGLYYKTYYDRNLRLSLYGRKGTLLI